MHQFITLLHSHRNLITQAKYNFTVLIQHLERNIAKKWGLNLPFIRAPFRVSMLPWNSFSSTILITLLLFRIKYKKLKMYEDNDISVDVCGGLNENGHHRLIEYLTQLMNLFGNNQKMWPCWRKYAKDAKTQISSTLPASCFDQVMAIRLLYHSVIKTVSPK